VSWTVYVALYGWVPVALLLFYWLPSRRAATMTLVLGYLFLPEAALGGIGGFGVSKTSIIGISLLTGVLLFDSGRVTMFRIHWFDIPMLVWCIAPLPTSLSNGLGAYDGLAGVWGAIVAFGIPYWVGRIYVRSATDLSEVASALVLSGLLYAPLCWYEIRLSPNLHHTVYGFSQHVFAQTRRFGGWRPMVFLQHGLALGMWMSAVAVVSFGLWRGRRLRRTLYLPPLLIVLSLGVTAIFCKSLGALVLGAMGTTVVLLCRLLRSRYPLVLLALLAPSYIAARAVLDWRAESVVEQASRIDHDRGLSIEGRIATDAVLRDRAMERPLFGWGGWNRIREGLPPMLTDSLWALVFAQKGLVGLVSFFGMLVVAQLLPLRRLRLRGMNVWEQPEILVLIAVLAMHTLDCTVNAMLSPVYIALAGALCGWGSEHVEIPARNVLPTLRQN